MERAHEREYDLLRVICCAAVVVLHTGSIYLAGWQPGMPAANRTAAALMQSLTRDAVPLFVMLSGAFLLPDPKSRDFRQFYRKSWKKMGVPTLVFSALYVAYAYAVLLAKIYIKHTAGTGQLGQPLAMWLNGVPYFHMWFMYMLAGLYAVTPVLASLKQRMGERAWLAAGVLCTLAGMALSARTALPWYLQWLLYLGYFMMGAYIRCHFRKKGENPLRNGYLCAGLFCLAAAARLFHRKLWYGILPQYEVIHPLSGLIVLSSMLVFAGFAGRRVTVDLSRQSRLTFYLYLFHGGVLSFLDILMRNVFLWEPGIPQILFAASLTWLISLVLSALCETYIRPGAREAEGGGALRR